LVYVVQLYYNARYTKLKILNFLVFEVHLRLPKFILFPTTPMY